MPSAPITTSRNSGERPMGYPDDGRASRLVPEESQRASSQELRAVLSVLDALKVPILRRDDYVTQALGGGVVVTARITSEQAKAFLEVMAQRQGVKP